MTVFLSNVLDPHLPRIEADEGFQEYYYSPNVVGGEGNGCGGEAGDLWEG